MQKPRLVMRLSHLIVIFLFLGVSLACGETPREIQERMRERLPEVDALKKKQVVGENRRGLLEPLKTLSKKQQDLVRDENADREKVYEALAVQSRTTLEKVAAIRARQIAERSCRGHHNRGCPGAMGGEAVEFFD